MPHPFSSHKQFASCVAPFFGALTFVALGVTASVTGAEAPKETPKITAVQIEPAEVVLSDADESAQFLVTLKMSDGTLRDATRQAEYSFLSADGKTDVATIESGRLKPKSDG